MRCSSPATSAKLPTSSDPRAGEAGEVHAGKDEPDEEDDTAAGRVDRPAASPVGGEPAAEHQARRRQRRHHHRRGDIGQGAVQARLEPVRGAGREDGGHRISDEDPGAEQSDRVDPDQQRSPDRAAHRPWRATQPDGEGQHQQTRHDEVGDLLPAEVANRQQADRVADRVVAGAGRALDQERDHEQRAADGAACEQRPGPNRLALHDAAPKPIAPPNPGDRRDPTGHASVILRQDLGWPTSGLLARIVGASGAGLMQKRQRVRACSRSPYACT
jgi:hypothetical protein